MIRIIFALGIMLGALPASAQSIAGCQLGIPCSAIQSFSAVAGQTITATTTSVATALAAVGVQYNLFITNTGSATAFVNLGGSGASTSATTGIPILTGKSIVIAAGSATYLATIAASGTVALNVQIGTGQPASF